MQKLHYLLAGALFLAACQTATEHQPENNARTVSSKSTPSLLSAEATCFQLTEEDSGLTSTTFITLRRHGNKIVGEQAIEMSGADYQAVAVGTLDGHIDGDVILVDYHYAIGGNTQVEQQEFRVLPDQLLQTNGQLEEQGERLVLAEKGLFNHVIPKIDCP